VLFDLGSFDFVFATMIIPLDFFFESSLLPNGLRYPRVGGTRQRHFDGTNFQPRKVPKNAATPTRRVHAVLGVFVLRKTRSSIKISPKLMKVLYTIFALVKAKRIAELVLRESHWVNCVIHCRR
jgi:hypothetical protein